MSIADSIALMMHLYTTFVYMTGVYMLEFVQQILKAFQTRCVAHRGTDFYQ